MATDAYVGVLESVDPLAKQIDNETNTIGGQTRYRQRVRAFQGDASGDATQGWANRLTTGTTFYDARDRNWTVTETVAVSGTFWQATQPVSLAALPALAAGSAVIGHVVVDSAPTTAVTGTFWQATQPVSGTFWQATQPVSGTFWQATQPVSGTVGVSNAFALDATLTGGTLQAQGNVGNAVADSGNPVKIGGVVRTTPSTGTDGQRLDWWMSTRGAGTVQITNSNGILVAGTAVTNTDGQGNVTGLVTNSRSFYNNGASWDMARGDTTSGAWVNVKNASIAVTAAQLPAALGPTMKANALPVVIAADTDDMAYTLRLAMVQRLDRLIAQFEANYSPPDNLY